MSGKEVRENDLKAIYTIESLANLGTFQVRIGAHCSEDISGVVPVDRSSSTLDSW